MNTSPRAGSGDANGMEGMLVPAIGAFELDQLRHARALLERPGLAAQLANVVGAPMEYVISRRLPPRASRLLHATTRAALERSLRLAATTLRQGRPRPGPRNGLHAAAVAATGAAGGAFGMAGLVAELPVTTTLILRSIADIARSHGEHPADPATALAVIQVLTMGGHHPEDDGAESGYFAARAVLAHQVAAATEYVAAHGLATQGGPAIVQLLGSVASRFSVKVSQKVAAQAIPVVGAASGAVLNSVFMRHFQRMAEGHFTVRALERRHGASQVRRAYGSLSS